MKLTLGMLFWAMFITVPILYFILVGIENLIKKKMLKQQKKIQNRD